MKRGSNCSNKWIDPSSMCMPRADKGARRRQACLVRAAKRRNTRHSAALMKPASRLLSSALGAPSPRRADETAFGPILRFSIAAGPITAGRGPGRQIIHCHWQAEFSALRHCAPSGFDGTSGFYGGRAGRKERLASPRLDEESRAREPRNLAKVLLAPHPSPSNRISPSKPQARPPTNCRKKARRT